MFFVGFLSRWYHEGILASPPPCLHNRAARNALSDNTCCGPISCVSVARWGTAWGDKNRAPIMFIAFWLSSISMILMVVTCISLSQSPSIVKNVSWTVGKGTVGATSDISFYVGLRLVAIECSGPACPPFEDFKWEDSDNKCVDSYCQDCRDAAEGSVSTAIIGLLTLIPQISTDIQRSKREGDLNCQKWWGIFTGILGGASSLFAMLQYTQGCFVNLPSDNLGAEMDYYLGPSFYCILVATLLKFYEIWAMLIVPVPESGYWGSDEEQDKKRLPQTDVEIAAFEKGKERDMDDDEKELAAG